MRSRSCTCVGSYILTSGAARARKTQATANAKASADYIVLNSKVIGDAVRDHKVGIVVAYYPMVSGKVERIPWEIPPVPEKK